MNDILEIMAKVLPIILLIIMGNILQKINFFTDNTVDELKKIVVNIALPALIFLAFTETKFQVRYSLIVASVMIVSAIMLLVGIFFKKVFKSDNKYFPVLFTSFETGMVGYSLFATVFGTGEMFKLALVDLGNGLFFFLFLVSYLEKLNGESKSIKDLLMSFVKSPIILAIFAGLTVGSTGLLGTLQEFSFSASILDMLSLLSALTVPVICLVIGYELQIDLKNILKPILVATLRIALLLSVAFLINTVVIRGILQLDKVFEIALYTMFLLPPSFIIPIFVKDGGEDKQFVLSVISINIILSIITFVGIVSII